jgi:hypothetical protein
MSRRRNRCLFGIVVCAAIVAWAGPFRQPNCNTASHYALVQSLAEGARTIDALHGQSCDVSWWHGHYYANKAPGLALVTVPWYLALKAVGLLRPDPLSAAPYPAAMRALPRRDLWLMGLWGAVLPSILLLFLLRREAERVSPGSGIAAAATLAFATLLLPFAGLFFSHALGAMLNFAAFSCLSRRRTPRRIAASGVLVGFATAVEYPNAILAVLLLAWVLIESKERLRHAAYYLSACVVGVAPLLAFDWWVFRSPLHLSYVGAVSRPGRTGHDVLGANTKGFFGVGLPTLPHLVHLLVGERGLLMTAPVLALAPIGFVRLWRTGHRNVATVLAATAITYLLYNAGYYIPLGGAVPGPRFLIAILPFVVLALSAAITAAPRLWSGFVALGTVVLLSADLTQPLIGHGYTSLSWWRWVRTGSFTSTILDPSAHSWPFAAAVAAVVFVGLGAGRVSLTRRVATERQNPMREEVP